MFIPVPFYGTVSFLPIMHIHYWLCQRNILEDTESVIFIIDYTFVFWRTGHAPQWVQTTLGVSVWSTKMPHRVIDSKSQAYLQYEIWDTQNAHGAIGKNGNKETRAGGAGVVQINWHSQSSSVQQVEAVHNRRRQYYEWEFVYFFNLYLTRNSLEAHYLWRDLAKMAARHSWHENTYSQFTTGTCSTIKHDLNSMKEMISSLI